MQRRREHAVVGLAAVAVLLLASGVLTARITASTPVAVDEAVATFRAQESGPPRSSPSESRESARPAPRAAAGTHAPGGAASAGPVAAASQAPSPAPDPVAPPPPAAEPPRDATAPAAPQAGVYRYATAGGEQLDVPGARHTYPPETTITVVPGGCGYLSRWQPLQERSEETETCTAATPTLARYRMYHEFLGQARYDEFTCSAGAFVYPPSLAPGTSWQARCDSADTTTQTALELVGSEVRDVGGQYVETLHLRYVTTFDGANRGTRRGDRWIAKADGLLVATAVDVDAVVAGPAGDVRYTERYELRLLSLAPQR